MIRVPAAASPPRRNISTSPPRRRRDRASAELSPRRYVSVRSGVTLGTYGSAASAAKPRGRRKYHHESHSTLSGPPRLPRLPRASPAKGAPVGDALLEAIAERGLADAEKRRAKRAARDMSGERRVDDAISYVARRDGSPGAIRRMSLSLESRRRQSSLQGDSPLSHASSSPGGRRSSHGVSFDNPS